MKIGEHIALEDVDAMIQHSEDFLECWCRCGLDPDTLSLSEDQSNAVLACIKSAKAARNAFRDIRMTMISELDFDED